MRAFALALFLVAGVAPARADTAAVEQAKAHLATAQRMFEVQQYDKAIEELQKAYVLDPKPEYLYALGQAFRLHGDCARAIKAYERYLKTNPAKSEVDKATSNIERCKADLAKPPPPPKEPPPLPPPAPTPPTPAPAPRDTSWTSDYVGHALVGGGVIALAVGSVLYLGGRSTIQSIDDAPSYDDFAERHTELDGAKLRQRIGITAAIAGAVMVGGGIWHYARRGRGGSLSAAVTPGGATVIVTRSF